MLENKFIFLQICTVFIFIMIICKSFPFWNNISDVKYKAIKEFEDSTPNIYMNEYFDKQILKIKQFREINSKNILLNKIKFTKNENPDVSVIITIYNQANCFHIALRSVQNQSLKNLEIIIIDDCSLDNSNEVIKKYLKEDKRIIYLRHKSNDGKIKSRSDGVRIAKGKYITIIDGDDSLSNENILYYCFSIASLADLDIVGFNIYIFRKNNFENINNYKNIKNLNNRIIYQPELYYKFVSFDKKESTEGFVNRNIVAKLIKNDIFKSVLEYIGPKYTEDYISVYEDTIMSVSLFRIANSYYQIKECGYYYSKEEECKASFPFLNFSKCKQKNFRNDKRLDPIKYLNFLLDKYRNNKIENYLLSKELISIDYYNNLDNVINANLSYTYSIIEKIINLNLYYNNGKNKISQIKKKLLKKQNIIK